MVAPRIGIAQMTSTSSIEHNLRIASDLIKSASDQGASLICLPECTDYIGDDANHSLSLASILSTSGVLQRLQSFATQADIWLSVGGLHELNGNDSTRIYNTHVILRPSHTQPHAIYRKLHLFHAQLASGLISEHVNTDAGHAMVVAYDTPFGHIGLSTCYDVRFPALYEALREAGASLVLVPSAFFVDTGRAHWHVLLRARAIENQYYVAAAAQVGAHNARRSSYGHALLADPYGSVVADARTRSPALLVEEIDVAMIERVRANMNCGAHRRDDVLGAIAKV